MTKASKSSQSSESTDRRTWLKHTATLTGSSAIALGLSNSMLPSLAASSSSPSTNATEPTSLSQSQFSDQFKVHNRKIRQSVMGWCFNPMSESELFDHCVEIGIEAIEGVDEKHFPEAVKKGLKVALVNSHGFGTGPLDPKNHAEVIAKLRSSILTAEQFGAPTVITFTGMKVPGISDSSADKNCLDCWKQVIGLAEEKKVTLVLEHLNSRDDSHPMKGHPGYYGDNVDHCIDLVQRMDSPYFKLLFDVYHVQIMNGDVIRRIREYHPLIGHYHTAGNPGRCEMDENQEINYTPIMKAIVATGYQGFVAQEFIPNWTDSVRALRHGAWVMDVD